MINIVAKILKALNSDDNPGHIALAICFAMILGFTPFMSLHNLLVLLLACLIRVNLSTLIAGFLVFTCVSFALDPLFHGLGKALLQSGSLKSLWTAMYNNPYWLATDFNNTVTLGSLVVSVVLVPVVYPLSYWLVSQYRDHILAWVKRTRLYEFVKSTSLYHTYVTLRG